MTKEKSYPLFVWGLKLEVKTSVGVNVLASLQDAVTWAQHVDLWLSKEGVGQEQEEYGKRKQKGELGNIFEEPGLFVGGQVVVVRGATL